MATQEPTTARDVEAVHTRWLAFAAQLRQAGLRLFDFADIKITDEAAADVRILGLLLLARTLSNLKACLLLLDSGFIVEAKTIARCCYENSYWVGALVREREGFRSAMVHHEMRHKRMRAQTLFASTRGLEGAIGDKLREWMRTHKQYEDSPTLEPKAVAERAQNNASYVFYQHLCWDAHPSVETLNRYYVLPDHEGIPTIDVDPKVKTDEAVEMLNLLCLAVIGVFLGVGELIGNDNAEAGAMAKEYQELTAASAVAGV